jgi:hypothetical protein
MIKYIKYFKYILRHKYYVFIECAKRGYIWRGLIHDLSKFRPSEFFAYAEHFYGSKDNQKQFDKAWLYHQKRNPHHHQYWVLIQDEELSKIIEMPHKYRVEMLCDWIGAGLAITGKRDIKEWYLKHKSQMSLGYKTRQYVEKEIGI